MKKVASRFVVLASSLVLAGGALLACSGGGGGGGTGPADESSFAGNCADGSDNDHDGLTDGADPNCGTETIASGTCSDGIDNDGDGTIDGADAGCGAPGDCTADFAPDGVACYRAPAVQQADCGGPFRLFLRAETSGGAVTFTVTTQDSPGGGGTQEPGIESAACAADCSGGDASVFTCDVTDVNGVSRTINGTLSAGRVVGTIETTCGTQASFVALPRPDSDCD
jgi:hypothetical protein